MPADIPGRRTRGYVATFRPARVSQAGDASVVSYATAAPGA
jgi:hypothetical protein